MKEKIGMEKLIELVNQYEIEKEKSEGVNVDAYVEFKWDYNYNRLVRYDETDHWEGDNLYGDTAVAYLISKSFGFIQRLVEHNKLLYPDFVQHLKLFYGDSMPESNFYLMMLSIADRPIYELNKMLRP